MLIIPPPMSTNERQRLFQLRHPGYDRRRKARRRARTYLAAKQKIAAMKAAALQEELQSTPVTIPVPATPVPLMLPAPVQDPLIAELNALAASMRQRELVPVSPATSGPLHTTLRAPGGMGNGTPLPVANVGR